MSDPDFGPNRPHKKHKSKIPNPEEEERFLQAVKMINPDDWLVYWLMGHRGLRVGEIVSNHRNRSNLPGLQIQELHENGIYVKGKKNHMDFVSLPKEIIVKLLDMAGRRKEGAIFQEVAKYADPVGVMDHRTKEYAHIAGIDDWQDIHPHAFRHAFGYKAAKAAEGNIYKVRDLMRHKDTWMSSRYVHTMDDKQKQELLSSMDGV